MTCRPCFALSFCLWLSACGAPPAPAPKNPDVTCDPAAPSVTLAQVQAQVFDIDCIRCHTAGGIGAQDMSTEAKSRANLIGRPSDYSSTLKKVDPRHPETSTLWLKVLGGSPANTGPQGESVGGPMPRGADPLPDAKKLLLKNWICTGAQ